MRKYIILLTLVSACFGATSTLTGTIKDSQGNPLNGTLTMRLPVPAQDVATSTAIAPTPVTFQVVNGAITGGAPLYDVLGLQPQNLYYIARAYDTTGALQFYGNFNVTGATYNLGTATPTVVTTSNVSYANVPFLSLTNVFTGNNTFTGTTADCILNTVIFIGGPCAALWGSGDIGSQANAAYASLPAAPSFGTIEVYPSTTAYAFSTPIVFGTAGKIIQFDLGGNTLNYTPTTATTAITLTYGASSGNGGYQPHGVRNGLLQNNGCPAGNGCGGYTSSSSATGIVVGNSSNTATGPQISNMVISGFANGIYLPVANNVMWGLVLLNDMISSNTTGLLCDIGGAYESLQAFAVRFTINQTGLAQKCNFDIYVHGGSFDGNNTAISQVGAHTFVDGTHFEMTNSSSVAIASISGGSVAFSNSFFLDDNASSSTTSWFTCTAGQFDFSHVDFSSAGRTTTASVINVASGCNLVGTGGITNDTPGVLTSLVQGASTTQAYLTNNNGATKILSGAYATTANCNVNTASPAACGAAPSGSVVVPTTTTTYTVNTTAVTANSRILILPITDNSGLSGSPTCNAPPTAFIGYQSGRVAGTSFTFTLPSTTGTSCWTFWIVN